MRKSFILYTDNYDLVKELPLEEKGNLFDAIFIYATENREIQLTNGETKMAFGFIKKTMERDNEKWKNIRFARKMAGRKGGLKKAENELLLRTKPSKTKQNLANLAVSANVNDSVSVNNKTNELNKNLISKPNNEVSSLKDSSSRPSTPKGLSKDFFDKALDLAEKLSAKKVEEERRAK